MAEWFIAAVLKTAVGLSSTKGSNPFLSAKASECARAPESGALLAGAAFDDAGGDVKVVLPLSTIVGFPRHHRGQHNPRKKRPPRKWKKGTAETWLQTPCPFADQIATTGGTMSVCKHIFWFIMAKGRWVFLGAVLVLLMR